MTDPDFENWQPRPLPTTNKLEGRYVDVVRYDRDAHAEALWQAFGGERTSELLFHFGWPKFANRDDLADQLDRVNTKGGFRTYVFIQKGDGNATGMASYMRMVPKHGVIETGAIAHGASLQNTRAGTEAHYLMAKHVFDDLGYRRYEWKLNNPNKPSHAAARRFGFTFEGVFRQHMVMPYGNRDTAWYSMLDSEWPLCKAAFEAWLRKDNFDETGRQKKRLEDIREEMDR